MSAVEQELVAACDEFRIPVEDIAPAGEHLITVDRASKLPTRDELTWLSAYRSFREFLGYTEREIQRMYDIAVHDGGYPVQPYPGSLYTYRFVKFDADDWAYASHGWTMAGTLPNHPALREWFAGRGETCLGPLTLRQLLDAISGHVKDDGGQSVVTPGARWVAWLRGHDPAAAS